MTIRIAMWSGPRNISTAMMRAWENRPDTAVIDEPFYANYLVATGVDHPGRAETLAGHEADAAVVAAMLTGSPPGGANVWYQKHMAHHLRPGMDRKWMDQVIQCFLIRSPREMLMSLHAKTPFPSLADTGLPQQVALFNEAVARGLTPPVLDARDVLEHPRDLLGIFCDRVGAPFEEAMLAWPAGSRDSDGAWAPYWYESVWSSTCFHPWKPGDGTVPDELKGLLDECEICYEQLYRHRITA